MNEHTDAGLPLEQFIQALTSQLDRAQATMALKARAGLPLTFAVKDLSLDLRTHVEMAGSVVRIRPAGPGESEASIIHLSLTTITRPMIEENTVQLAAVDEPPLHEVLGKDISPEEQRRLEWAGIYNVAQLREVQRHGGADAIERVADIPVNRLRKALERASMPFISHVMPLFPPDGETQGQPLLRIRGGNLYENAPPRVTIDGDRVPVVQASTQEIVVAPLLHQMAGTFEVETAPGRAARADVDLTPFFPDAAANVGGAP